MSDPTSVNGIVLYDLEFTAWEGSQERDWTGEGEFREIIQIGAVRLDPARGHAETGRFERLVTPWHNPDLSDYVSDLTGITGARIAEEGVPFADAYRDFEAFVGGEHAYAFGTDYKVLCENCGLNRVSAPPTHRFHNLRPFLSEIVDGIAMASTGDLPAMLGIPHEGAVHSAADDAAALGAVLRALIADGRLAGLPETLGA